MLDEIVKLLPTKYVAPATLAFLILTQVGRAWHAWTSGGGWVGIKNAILFGTNIPKPPTNP